MTEPLIPETAVPFLGAISFEYNAAKGQSCIEWVSNSLPGVSWSQTVLVLLCAESLHLHQYGRPVTGAAYRFDGDVVASADLEASLSLGLKVYLEEDGLPSNMSVSDGEAINEVCYVLAEYGEEALVKRAREWRYADSADYALMVDLGKPGAEELLYDLMCFGRQLVF